MSQDLPSWTERLTAQPLPVMQVHRRGILEMLDNDSWSMQDYARHISVDPGFAALVIGGANKQLRAAGRNDASSPENAIGVYGKGAFEDLVMHTHIMERLIEDEAHRFGFRQALARSHHAAVIAEAWSRRRGDSEPAANFMSGLLHNVAELALWTHAGETMRAIFGLMRDAGLPQAEAAEQVLGVSLDDLSREICRTWHLPHLLENAFRSNLLPTERPLGIRLAGQIALEAERGWYHPRMQQLKEQACTFVGGQPQPVIGELHQLVIKNRTHFEKLDTPCPARWLPLVDASTLELNAELCADPPAAAEAETPAAPSGDTRSIDYEAVYRRTQSAVARARSTSQVITAILQALHKEAGLDRVLFALLDREKQHLEGKIYFGQKAAGSLKGLQIDLRKPSLFSVLIKKPQVLWLNPENRSRLAKLIPGDFKEALKDDQLFLMSIHVNSRPLGVICADRPLSQPPLDEAAFTCFRKHCRLLMNCISSQKKAVKTD